MNEDRNIAEKEEQTGSVESESQAPKQAAGQEPGQSHKETSVSGGSRRQRDRKRLYSSLLSCILWISVLDFLVKLLTGVVTTVMYMTGTPMSGLSVWSLVLTLWNVVIQSMTPLYIAFAALAADRLLRILDQNSQHTEKA
ncbi:hypothetical protein [Faecalibaculum rodentium]|uniref:hypothetical protein n=1 Tax=Faecalibaculum rodentium TaxID=1702221 RepID=UPI00258C3FF4|nr:hypothetical protein [Faecalibaculum rodentium]